MNKSFKLTKVHSVPQAASAYVFDAGAQVHQRHTARTHGLGEARKISPLMDMIKIGNSKGYVVVDGDDEEMRGGDDIAEKLESAGALSGPFGWIAFGRECH